MFEQQVTAAVRVNSAQVGKHKCRRGVIRTVLVSVTAGLVSVALLSSVASAASPVGAPANNVGPLVSGLAKSGDFGPFVASLTPISDDALGNLGLTPPN